MSRLFVAVCVLGCLYAAQAHVFVDDHLEIPKFLNVDPTTLSNTDLIRVAFQKFFKSVDTLDEVQVRNLRQYMVDNFNLLKTKLVHAHHNVEADAIKVNVCFDLPLKDLVKLGYRHNLRLLDLMTEQEIKEWRELCIKFVEDQTPDLGYYIETGHENLVVRPLNKLREEFEIPSVRQVREVEVDVEERTYKELLFECVRKLYSLRDGVWASKKTDLKRMIVKVIMRADEELVKINKEVVDKMIDRTPYEELYSIPLSKLGHEAVYRIEALIENAWEDKTSQLKTALVDFLNVVDEKIVKFNNQIE